MRAPNPTAARTWLLGSGTILATRNPIKFSPNERSKPSRTEDVKLVELTRNEPPRKPPFFSELFGTGVRYTGASVGFQPALSLAGRLVPLVSMAVTQWSDGEP
jgi:hypothetical protein